MKQEISQLLKQKRPASNNQWEEKLPRMAERLEQALYSHSASKEEYSETSNLKLRLQSLAQSMGGRQPRRPGDPQPRGPVPQPGAGQPLPRGPGMQLSNAQQMAGISGGNQAMVMQSTSGPMMQQNSALQTMSAVQTPTTQAMHPSAPRMQGNARQQQQVGGTDMSMNFDGTNQPSGQSKRCVRSPCAHPIPICR